MTPVNRGLIPVVLLGLLLTACTGPGPASQTSAPPVPTTSATTTAMASALAPAVPKVGGCYDLGTNDLDQPTNASPLVDCSSQHTSVTVAVLKHFTPSQVTEITNACTRAVRRHIGTTPLQYATTMVRAVWFLPTSPAATWVRCDMVVYASADSLAPLPKRTVNWWKRDRRAIGTCGTSAPGTTGFDRVLCASDTPWRVLVALPVDGKAYPGVKTLRTQADYRCSDSVRLAKNLALKYDYGYEWPTRSQWQDGQHYLLCWMKG